MPEASSETTAVREGLLSWLTKPELPKPELPKPELELPEPELPEPELPKPELELPELELPEPEEPEPEYALPLEEPEPEYALPLEEPEPEYALPLEEPEPEYALPLEEPEPMPGMVLGSPEPVVSTDYYTVANVQNLKNLRAERRGNRTSYELKDGSKLDCWAGKDLQINKATHTRVDGSVQEWKKRGRGKIKTLEPIPAADAFAARVEKSLESCEKPTEQAPQLAQPTIMVIEQTETVAVPVCTLSEAGSTLNREAQRKDKKAPAPPRVEKPTPTKRLLAGAKANSRMGRKKATHPVLTPAEVRQVKRRGR